MDHTVLFNVFIFLAAACLVVPLAGKFRLGSVLGYLAAGILIGPFGLGFIHNPEEIIHFAEFGVVMMLFLIGLELEPATLWRLRMLIVGLGGLQLVLTSIAFTGIGLAVGADWRTSLVCGMALALSSTALVLQMLEEKGLLQTSAGERAFSVLLFQDIAVIPLLLILPLLAVSDVQTLKNSSALSELPGWAHTLVVVAIIVAMVVGGKYLSRHLFGFIARTQLREVFTALSLALVVGISLLMQVVGISPALGAFIAGVVLASSEYRHTLETDIQPFKGLLLGLFFISVGMGMDFSLLASAPEKLAASVVALVVVKAAVLAVLGLMFGLRGGQCVLFTLALAQGGEFAFVLFQYAQNFALLSVEDSRFLTLTVALSMAATPFLMLLNERFVIPRFMSVLPTRDYDAITESNPVIIAGYGRFGQIIGRFLRAQGIGVTVLEKDPDQIELIRKFGGKGYFGDASRLDLLTSAGAQKARLLVVAVDDADKCLEIVRLAKTHFPHLTVYARARNRRHAYELHKAGVDYFHRETFDSSLHLAAQAAIFLGLSKEESAAKMHRFKEHDQKTLRESFAFFDEERALIGFSRQATGELEQILRQDSVEPQPQKSA